MIKTSNYSYQAIIKLIVQIKLKICNLSPILTLIQIFTSQISQAQMRTQNSQLQKFEKIKVLGQGTYGKCYLVNHVQESQLCVLKQIQIKGMNEEEIQQTMKQAKILQALDHPCIVKCLDAFVQEGFLNIVMNYADAGDLSKKLKDAKGSQFSQNQILNWFTQICLAMKHVHDRKIIHRDLKTQNIFLTSDGLIKLGDFGIAKPLQLTLQKIKTVVGTPYYMSPQICENKQYSFKADVWSLGVILFQMCALKPPFDAGSLPALALKISRGQYSALPSNYSKDIRKLVNELLQVDPIKRPSINEVLKFPIIKNRIDNFLPRGIRERQFSHTTLHSQNIFQRQDLKKQITKLARDNTQINSIISPRNGGNQMGFASCNTPQNKGTQFFSKINIKQAYSNSKNIQKKQKKTHEMRKRQNSQPNLTPKNTNNDNKKSESLLIQQKKMKSNVSLTNLQRKKSDKYQTKTQKQKHFYNNIQSNLCFRKKKSSQKDIKSELSEIKQIRSQVIELHGQLSSRNNQNPNINTLNNNSEQENNDEDDVKIIKSVKINNYIKEEIQEDEQIHEQQRQEINQNYESEHQLDEQQGQDLSQNQQQNEQDKQLSQLSQSLQKMLLEVLSEKQFSKNYQIIQQNKGIVNYEDQKGQQKQQKQYINQKTHIPYQGLFSLLYALNTCFT